MSAATPPLAPALTDRVLAYLGVERARPSPDHLEALVHANVRRVPWESAFRIVRRATTARRGDCPRWPEQFWAEAVERGGGGTCFESNYAFYTLLLALGYEGYLTINNMGEEIACHTAIVVCDLAGRRWLVDAGLPLYTPIPLTVDEPSRAPSPFHTYTIRPDGSARYQVERDRHPRPNCFTLVDRPVADSDYREATAGDYGPEGYFLDRVLVNKVVGGVPWRFNSAERPLHLESYAGGKRVDHRLQDAPAEAISRHFGMDHEVVRTALEIAGGG